VIGQLECPDFADTILSKFKTGRDDKSFVGFIPPPRGPSSVQVRELPFYSLSNSGRHGL
jgi:hypothetical protein